MSWRDLVLRVLRVPPEPEPPPGSPPRVFHAAPSYFTLRAIQWAFGTLVFLFAPVLVSILVTTLAASGAPTPVIILVGVLAAILWIIQAVQVFFGWAVLRLDYEMRWYMLSDRAIRIREGIVNVREKTMALANVQNISIRQGPLQRLLGIADVEVKTAGGGGSGTSEHQKGRVAEPMHVAFFRGVDNAEIIRDLVRESVRRQRDAGLGDADDHSAHVAPPSGATTIEAAQTLLREARKLRAVVEEAAR